MTIMATPVKWLHAIKHNDYSYLHQAEVKELNTWLVEHSLSFKDVKLISKPENALFKGVVMLVSIVWYK